MWPVDRLAFVESIRDDSDNDCGFRRQADDERKEEERRFAETITLLNLLGWTTAGIERRKGEDEGQTIRPKSCEKDLAFIRGGHYDRFGPGSYYK